MVIFIDTNTNGDISNGAALQGLCAGRAGIHICPTVSGDLACRQCQHQRQLAGCGQLWGPCCPRPAHHQRHHPVHAAAQQPQWVWRRPIRLTDLVRCLRCDGQSTSAVLMGEQIGTNLGKESCDMTPVTGKAAFAFCSGELIIDL